jgi:hypothetical protein
MAHLSCSTWQQDGADQDGVCVAAGTGWLGDNCQYQYSSSPAPAGNSPAASLPEATTSQEFSLLPGESTWWVVEVAEPLGAGTGRGMSLRWEKTRGQGESAGSHSSAARLAVGAYRMGSAAETQAGSGKEPTFKAWCWETQVSAGTGGPGAVPSGLDRVECSTNDIFCNDHKMHEHDRYHICFYCDQDVRKY